MRFVGPTETAMMRFHNRTARAQRVRLAPGETLPLHVTGNWFYVIESTNEAGTLEIKTDVSSRKPHSTGTGETFVGVPFQRVEITNKAAVETVTTLYAGFITYIDNRLNLVSGRQSSFFWVCPPKTRVRSYPNVAIPPATKLRFTGQDAKADELLRKSITVQNFGAGVNYAKVSTFDNNNGELGVYYVQPGETFTLNFSGWVQVENYGGGALPARVFEVWIRNPRVRGLPPVITGYDIVPFGTIDGVTYDNYPIAASNSPFIYAVSNLPATLSLNEKTGLVTMADPAAGWNPVDRLVLLHAVNEWGHATKEVTFRFVEEVIPAPVVTPSGHRDWANYAGTQNYQIVATNAPTYYDIVPLPIGLRINHTTGFIDYVDGDYFAALAMNPDWTNTTEFELRATNAGGTGTAAALFQFISPDG